VPGTGIERLAKEAIGYSLYSFGLEGLNLEAKFHDVLFVFLFFAGVFSATPTAK
jgi:hypothetical protein